MVVLNKMSRFHLAMNAVSRLPNLDSKKFVAFCEEKLTEHQKYVAMHGKDMPEIENWKWGDQMNPYLKKSA